MICVRCGLQLGTSARETRSLPTRETRAVPRSARTQRTRQRSTSSPLLLLRVFCCVCVCVSGLPTPPANSPADTAPDPPRPRSNNPPSAVLIPRLASTRPTSTRAHSGLEPDGAHSAPDRRTSAQGGWTKTPGRTEFHQVANHLNLLNRACVRACRRPSRFLISPDGLTDALPPARPLVRLPQPRPLLSPTPTPTSTPGPPSHHVRKARLPRPRLLREAPLSSTSPLLHPLSLAPLCSNLPVRPGRRRHHGPPSSSSRLRPTGYILQAQSPLAKAQTTNWERICTVGESGRPDCYDRVG